MIEIFVAVFLMATQVQRHQVVSHVLWGDWSPTEFVANYSYGIHLGGLGISDPSRCMTVTQHVDEDGLLYGSISSFVDNATGTYLPNQRCLATIVLHPQSSVIVSVEAADMEVCGMGRCLCDFVLVTEITSKGKGRTSKLCIKDSKGHHYAISSNKATVEFKSDGGVQPSYGFRGTWQEVRMLNSCALASVISNDFGILESPQVTNGTHLLCRWYFHAKPGYVWEFRFLEVLLDEFPDVPACTSENITCQPCPEIVQISEQNLDEFEHDNKAAKTNRELFHTRRCGTSIPNMSYTTFSANNVRVYYLHPADVNRNVSSFRLYYEQVLEPCRQLRVRSSEIPDAIKPDLKNGRYRPNQNCQWLIGRSSQSEQFAINASFLEWDLAECKHADNGSCDQLILYDGDSSESKIIARLVGKSPHLAPYYVTTSTSLFVQFVTNRHYEQSGFVLEYRGVEADDFPCLSTRRIVDVEKPDSLSNYRRSVDGHYRSKENCDWHLVASDSRRFRLTVRQVDIDNCGIADNCLCDWLSIYDGAGNKRKLVATFCGSGHNVILGNDVGAFVSTNSSVEVLFEYNTTRTEALISFRTDSINSPNSGFVIDYETIDPLPLAESDSSSSTSIIALALSICFGVVTLCMIFVAVYVFDVKRRRKMQLQKAKEALDNWKLSGYLTPAANFNELLKEMGLDELRSAIEKLNVEEKWLEMGDVVGQGQFGVVRRALMRKPVPGQNLYAAEVAVKATKTQMSEEIVKFLREALLMTNFDHPNILRLIGIAIIMETPHLVFPLMSKGNLRDFLRQKSPDSMKNATLLDFCRQICDGMVFISDKFYVHRDLAARNVLVSEDCQVKISDFGFAKELDNSGYYCWSGKANGIPIRWHPPESIRMNMYDIKSDVWSFGVVCWEILTFCRTEPYFGIENNEISEYLRKGNRLKKPPETCTEDFYNDTMLQCWNDSRFARPTFQVLVLRINEELELMKKH